MRAYLRGGRALLVLGAVLVAAGWSSNALADDDEERETRVSELSLSKDEAWRSQGFRLQVGLGYERFVSDLQRVPPMHGYSILLRTGWRFNEHWSLLGAARYAVTFGDLDGLRWTATVEPRFNPLDGLAVSLGIGFGGILGLRAEGTHPGCSDGPVPGSSAVCKCNGGGFVATAKVEYLIAVAELFATGPVLHLDAQWTRCTDRTTPPGQERQERVQWWRDLGLGIAWVTAWR